MKASLQNSNGGGRGTNANTILNYMKDKNQDMYDRLDSYYIFNTSPTLHELQIDA
jgi:SAM-dependent MidA family methyltransferase